MTEQELFLQEVGRRIAERRKQLGMTQEMLAERGVLLAQYIIEHKATVRSAAKRFGVSKSTVHKDLSERLPGFNRPLYLQVKQVLEENKAQRHIRGGMATREKYRHLEALRHGNGGV